MIRRTLTAAGFEAVAAGAVDVGVKAVDVVLRDSLRVGKPVADPSLTMRHLRHWQTARQLPRYPHPRVTACLHQKVPRGEQTTCKQTSAGQIIPNFEYRAEVNHLERAIHVQAIRV